MSRGGGRDVKVRGVVCVCVVGKFGRGCELGSEGVYRVFFLLRCWGGMYSWREGVRFCGVGLEWKGCMQNEW